MVTSILPKVHARILVKSYCKTMGSTVHVGCTVCSSSSRVHVVVREYSKKNQTNTLHSIPI